MLKKFLTQQMGTRSTKPYKISSGMFSDAYLFVANSKEYVLRLNKDEKDFNKDNYAYEHFGKILPIPKILKHGKYNDEYYFAITLKCSGITHDKLEPNNTKNLLPELIRILEVIRLINIKEKQGFGLLDENGIGQNDSWQLALTSFYNHKFPQINIEQFFGSSALDRKFFNKYFKKLLNLLAYIPQEKYLIHGDFGFDNLVVDNNHITGILDWAESKYGDFLYDVAWLDFWSNDIAYAKIFKNYYSVNKIKVPHFDERILCYRLYIGLNSLILAAYLQNEQDYQKVKDRINKCQKLI